LFVVCFFVFNFIWSGNSKADEYFQDAAEILVANRLALVRQLGPGLLKAIVSHGNTSKPKP
jgi:hypothetical protein